MPTVLRVGRLAFYFYSNEGSEDPHIHVDAAEKSAKYWLNPIELQSNSGFRSGERREIEGILGKHRDELMRRWNEHHHQAEANRAKKR